MKITIIALQSIDGFIAADQSDDLSWGSKEDKRFFSKKTKEIGSMLMGSKTFESMPEKAFAERFGYVATSDPSRYEQKDHLTFLSGTAVELVSQLEEHGVQHIALVGGGNLYGQFLKEGLVTDMYLTIAPVILGKGIRLFENVSSFHKFELNSSEVIGNSELLNYYKYIG